MGISRFPDDFDYDNAQIILSTTPPVGPSIGDIWIDTDDPSSTAYATIEDVIAYGGSGKDLAYAEGYVAQAGITTTVVTPTGMTINFDVTDRPVMVQWFAPWISATDADSPTDPGGYALYILDGAGSAMSAAAGIVQTTSTAHVASTTCWERITVPGNYTRKGGIAASGDSVVTFGANLSYIKHFIRATEC